jgi:two-component system CheB/CheR fusion protein
MNNLLTATEIASIFLDSRLRIKRYTPAAARIIKLIPTDIGRPLDDLKTSFPQVDLARQTKNVLDDLNTLEMKVMSKDHAWYQLKVMPYRTTDNVIDGVVLTLINIQQQIGQNEDQIRRFATVLQDANDAIAVLDFEGRILAWNKGAEKMYGWTQAEALTMNAADIVPEDRQKELRSLIARIKSGEEIRSTKTQRKTKQGQILNVWLTATVLTDTSGRPVEMATTERDLAWLSEGA